MVPVFEVPAMPMFEMPAMPDMSALMPGTRRQNSNVQSNIGQTGRIDNIIFEERNPKFSPFE